MNTHTRARTYTHSNGEETKGEVSAAAQPGVHANGTGTPKAEPAGQETGRPVKEEQLEQLKGEKLEEAQATPGPGGPAPPAASSPAKESAAAPAAVKREQDAEGDAEMGAPEGEAGITFAQLQNMPPVEAMDEEEVCMCMALARLLMRVKGPSAAWHMRSAGGVLRRWELLTHLPFAGALPGTILEGVPCT